MGHRRACRRRPARDIPCKAFVALLNDPAFKADAEKRGADLLPMPGAELAAYIKDVVATPADIINKTN